MRADQAHNQHVFLWLCGSLVFVSLSLILKPARITLAEGTQSPVAFFYGTTTRISVASNGAQSLGRASSPAISASGRFVAFSSAAADLVAGKNNWCAGQGTFGSAHDCSHIFVHDRETGLTERVSLSPSGAQADGDSDLPSISGDGRYVAFTSSATNLAPGGASGCFAAWVGPFTCSQAFVHDQETGITVRASKTNQGAPGNDSSYSDDISSDGRYLVYSSSASNILPGVLDGGTSSSQAHTKYQQVYRYDRVMDQTTLVSTTADGCPGDGASSRSSISDNGRYVAFQSAAPNLAPSSACRQDLCTQILVRDLVAGHTTPVTVTPAGIAGNGNSGSPQLSADGQYVVFTSSAGNLVPGDTNICPGHVPYFEFPGSCSDVFVHDRQTGQTSRVSVAFDGFQGESRSYGGVLSANGRFIAFNSSAGNLVPDDSNSCEPDDGLLDSCTDVFVYDRQTQRVKRISVASDGAQADGNRGSDYSSPPAISSDGRYIAFTSYAANLVPDDTNGSEDVFVHDLMGGKQVPALYATPPSCQIQPETGICAVTLQISNPQGLPVQLWVQENDGTEKQVTGTFSTTDLTQTIPWIRPGSTPFLLYDVRDPVRRLLASTRTWGQLPTGLSPELFAYPSECQIIPGQYHCAVRLLLKNPARMPLQIRTVAFWSTQLKPLTGIFTDAGMNIDIPWISGGGQEFLIFDLSGGASHLVKMMEVRGKMICEGHGAIDYPPPYTVISKPIWVEGWQLASCGYSSLDVLIDGKYVGTTSIIAYPRPDVCDAYPNYPSCSTSGFAYKLDPGPLSPGLHTLQIRTPPTSEGLMFVTPALPQPFIVAR